MMIPGLWAGLVLQAAVAVTPPQTLAGRRIGGLVASPDGGRVAFTVTEPLKGTSSTQHIHVLDVASRTIHQFTASSASEWAPAWSPDGSKLAFLTDRAGSPRIWTMSVSGGEAQPLFEGKGGVQSFAWSPEGKRIAYLAADDPTDDEEKKAKDKDDARLVDQPGRESGIWIYPLDGGKPRRMTGSRWRISDFVWYPTGDRLAVAATDHPEQDRWTDRLFTLAAADTGLTELTRPNGSFGEVQLSKDGQTLSFTGSPEGGPTPHDLYLLRPGSREPVNLTRGLDAIVERYQWLPDGSVLAMVGRGFGTEILSIRPDGRAEPVLGLPAVVSDLAVTTAGFAAVAGSATQGSEVWLAATGSAPTRVSHFNAARDSLNAVPQERFSYKSFDGTKIEAALLLPRTRAAGARLPLIVMIHGGPTGSWGDSYEPWGQLLVARGYGVFYPNIRGSTGYGWKFLTSNRGDWGGGDFKDLMVGVDTLIGRGIADPERLGIGGWSYGGYMASWAITQTTRFKAAITGAGMSDLAVEYGTEAGPQYDEWFYGLPWEKPEGFKKSSPLTFVTRVKTPTLILQGEQDITDPISQSQMLYRALKRLGVPTELVLYPREGHGLREEKHLLDRLDRVVEWFGRWIKP